MSFKSKTIGIIAGTALTLSIASGAMAQTGHETDTSVLLENGDPCAVEPLTGTSIDFGSANWNGTEYVGALTPGSITIPVSNGVFDVSECTVAITVKDLLASDSDSDLISGNAVTLNGGSGNTISGSGSVVIPENDDVVFVVTLSLNGVTVEPDTYVGDIEIGTTTGS